MNLKFEECVENQIVKAYVSPCSIDHPEYSLQLRVELPNGSHGFVASNTAYKDSTNNDAIALIRSIKLKTCCTAGCNEHCLDGTTCKIHTGDKCWKCYSTQEGAVNEDKELIEKLSLLVELEKKYSQGYTVVVKGWVHSKTLPAKETFIFFKNKPSKSIIQLELRKLGSHNAQDFEIHNIEKLIYSMS